MPSYLERLRLAQMFPTKNPFSVRPDVIPPSTIPPMREPEPPIVPLAGNLATIGQSFWKQPGQEQQPTRTVMQGMNPYQEAQLALREKERESREKIAAEREETRRAGQDITAKRAAIYEFKAKNPGAKFLINKKTGAMQAVNPVTGEMIGDFGQMELGQEDLINLNAEKAQELAETRGEQTRLTAEERAEYDRKLAELRAELDVKLKQTPGAADIKPEIGKEKLSQQFARAQEAFNTHPDWQNYIKLTPEGGFMVTKPFWGGDDKTLKEVTNFIYDQSNVPTTPKTPTEEEFVELKDAKGITRRVPKGKAKEFQAKVNEAKKGK